MQGIPSKDLSVCWALKSQLCPAVGEEVGAVLECWGGGQPCIFLWGDGYRLAICFPPEPLPAAAGIRQPGPHRAERSRREEEEQGMTRSRRERRSRRSSKRRRTREEEEREDEQRGGAGGEMRSRRQEKEQGERRIHLSEAPHRPLTNTLSLFLLLSLSLPLPSLTILFSLLLFPSAFLFLSLYLCL